MKARQQFIRYAVVGFASNASLYLLYLVATWLGVGPKTAMTCLYMVGVLQTFVFNKSWTFRYAGAAPPALFRYSATYALGYLINLAALLVLVDQVGLPHQLVQGIVMVVVAVMVFAAQRYWVFPQVPRSDIT